MIEEQLKSSEHIINLILMSDVIKIWELSTIKEAMKNLDWRVVMQAKYDIILQNGTWEFVNLPIKRKVIDIKWVWNAKYKSDIILNKYKVMLVAKSFARVENFDF